MRRVTKTSQNLLRKPSVLAAAIGFYGPVQKYSRIRGAFDYFAIRSVNFSPSRNEPGYRQQTSSAAAVYELIM